MQKEDMHMQRMSCEDKGSDQDDVPNEHHELPANHQRPGDRHETDSPSQPSEGTKPAYTLIWNF